MHIVLLLALAANDDLARATTEVRAIHGAPTHGVPGPWALLGHRIGQDALKRFGKSKEQTWDLVITHRAPAEVKYACMLDGLQASTGASAGKLNLKHEVITEVESVARDKKSGRVLRYRPSKRFVAELGNADYAEFPAVAKTLFAAPLEAWVDVSEDATAK